MKILMIGSDRKLFEHNSTVSKRIMEYGSKLNELHIVVFAKKELGLKPVKLGENVWVYPTGSTFRFMYMGDALNIARELKHNGQEFDLITTQDPFESGWAGVKIARKLSIALHVQVHTDFLSRYFKKVFILNKIRVFIAKRIVLPRAGRIRTVSKKIKNSIVEIMKISEEKISVLPIFTDSKRLSEAEIKVDLHKKYPQFTFIALMASRFTAEKNIEFAIRAFRSFLNHVPDAGLVIFGQGPYEKELRQIVEDSELGESVVIDDWQRDLASYYKTADVFMLTSYYEGFGLTLAEAIVCGCPVVSSDVGIARELIEENTLGKVCEVNDIDCFVSSLYSIYNDPSFRERARKVGPSVVADLFPKSEGEYLERYIVDWRATTKP